MKNLKIYIILTSLILVSNVFYAQDKLFFRNGTTVICKISAISENTITYKDTLANSLANTVSKKEILIAEFKTGQIYIFGSTEKSLNTNIDLTFETREQRKERKMKEWQEKEQQLPNGILGFYPVQIIAGRFTVSYERLFANKTMGVTVPVSLTYDMLSVLNALSTPSSSSTGTSSSSTTNPSTQPTQSGVGIISGVDLNYYHDLKPELKYFFGPRFRYGTAMTFGGIEYLSFQIQNGIMKSSGKKLTNTLSIGVGFFKLSEKYANYPGYEPNQVYPTCSVTWRLGFRL
jgi:hypothetical protein